MDEGLGILVGIGLAIALVVWLIGMVLLALAWTFSALTALLGHPAFVVAIMAGIGGVIGWAQLQRKHGAATAASSDDFAEIGPVRLTADGWAMLVLVGFIACVTLYGVIMI